MRARKVLLVLMALICFVCSFTYVSRATGQDDDGTRASGLIFRYNLAASKENSTTLYFEGITDCDPVVVKCGFKNLKVQRRANSSSSWSDYHDYGNVYEDTDFAAVGKYLSVDPGYQYRVVCKHYAKKNILNIQTISNSSNIVTF